MSLSMIQPDSKTVSQQRETIRSEIGNGGKNLISWLLSRIATALSSSVVRQVSRATRTAKFLDVGTWQILILIVVRSAEISS